LLKPVHEQMEESREVNSAFPDALKEPILRRIQFSTVSRVDNLGEFDSIVFRKLELTLSQWMRSTK
jgi:hypothetical protein